MPPGVRVFVATRPVDLRASFYGLAAHVRGTLGADPQSGTLFLFIGKGRKLVKVLFWDRQGYCIFSKKLEQGRFALFDDVPEGAVQHEVDFTSLTLFLEGVDLSARRRKPYQAPALGGRTRET